MITKVTIETMINKGNHAQDTSEQICRHTLTPMKAVASERGGTRERAPPRQSSTHHGRF